MTDSSIPTRPLGRTGVRVSALGLGGYHLGDVATQKEAIRIVHAAVDAGVTFMDNAWEYHEGKSEERMGLALAGRRDDVFLMTKCCSHGRDAKTAMRQLEQSLKRLKTDHLDLWQIHEVVYDDDPARHYAPGGAVEALEQARRQGKTRFVGNDRGFHPRRRLRRRRHGEAGASNPARPYRQACEIAGGATHEPHKTHPTRLDVALAPLTEILRPFAGERQD